MHGSLWGGMQAHSGNKTTRQQSTYADWIKCLSSILYPVAIMQIASLNSLICCAALCQDATLKLQSSNPYNHEHSAGSPGEISNDKELAASLAEVRPCWKNH